MRLSKALKQGVSTFLRRIGMFGLSGHRFLTMPRTLLSTASSAGASSPIVLLLDKTAVQLMKTQL